LLQSIITIHIRVAGVNISVWSSIILITLIILINTIWNWYKIVYVFNTLSVDRAFINFNFTTTQISATLLKAKCIKLVLKSIAQNVCCLRLLLHLCIGFLT